MLRGSEFRLPKDFFPRLTDEVRQQQLQRVVQKLHDRHPDDGEANQLLSERDPKNYLGDLYTEPKVSDLDTLTILADEYEELEKERKAFEQENQFSRTKSAAPTQATCEDSGNQDKRGNDQWSPLHQVQRQQATKAPREGPWTPPQQQQRPIDRYCRDQYISVNIFYLA